MDHPRTRNREEPLASGFHRRRGDRRPALGRPGDVMAQTWNNAPAKTQDRMLGGQDLEGRMRDVGNERITPDRNGQKVATAVQVNPAAESGAGSK